MYRMFKACILVLVSISSSLCFSMHGMNAIERARDHFDRMAEYSHKTKLLEHSSFTGESLNFQNRFFTSKYMELPGDIASHILLISKNVSVDPSGLVFAYHGHYRKQSNDLIQSFAHAYLQKAELYDRQYQKLFLRPDSSERLLSLNIMMHNDLGLRNLVYDDMAPAFHANHYPIVLEIYQRYYNTSRLYQ